MASFTIDKLDHVAIRVKNLDDSVRWYSEVLGLRKVHPKEWKDYPIFMLCGDTGIALFPAQLDHPDIDLNSLNIRIDHFAFNVSNEDFQKAQDELKQKDIEYRFADHKYFHSIYIKDPDGHEVELTTQIVEYGDFYSL